VNPARLRLAPALVCALGIGLGGAGCEPAAAPAVDDSGPVAGWPTWGGEAGGARYSPLTQITRENVAQLELAWSFHTGDVADGSRTRGKSVFEATPILDGDALYFCSPFNRVFALDAETGRQRWVFDPKVEVANLWQLACRGVALFHDPERAPGQPCRRRILTGTVDGRLLALDAEDGALCRDFGEGGSIDLTRGLGEVMPGEYGVTSPPTLIGDVVAVGALVGDGRRTDAPSGVVRGFDARSGALRWAFDPVPPGSQPLPPAADGSPRWRPGTPNAWSVFSADPARDLLFVPMGNAGPDFYGGVRNGLDHFSSALVALRGSSGELLWSFQTVHHDLWDYDVSSQPTLIAVQREGRGLPAVAQATKMGHVFLLDRETGTPLFPVEERAVPQEGGPDEKLSPTQPFPTIPPPLHPSVLTPEDAWGLTPWDRGLCRDKIAASRSEGIFTPPTLAGSVQFPGVAGGFNWGSLAFDPQRRLLVANANRMANLVTLIPREHAAEIVREDGLRRGIHPQLGTPFAATVDVLASPLGVPCTPPPWGSLLALEVETGRVIWEVPFGSTRDLAPFPFWLEWGLPSMGGPILTASGLVFIGAAMDDYLRAFDVETGALLWKARLPAGAQATPMTYRLRPDGRQFLVIAAGGHGTMGTTQGDQLLAFRLPR
jgi:quinoprotein glucose dehydrogenase